MKLRHISIMNVLMCFCVILIHLTAHPVTVLRHDSMWYSLFFSINKLLTFAVPAFLFLSGFKLFYKYADNSIDVKSFYLGRFRKIVVPYLVAYVVYFLYYLLNHLTKLSEFLPGLLLGTLVAHFYYIVLAIQFYLLYPLIHQCFLKHPNGILWFSFVVTMILNQFISFPYDDRFFGKYLFYFVMGMYLAKNFSQKEIRPINACAIPLILVAVVHTYFSYKMSLGGFYYRMIGIVHVIYVSLACITIYAVCMKLNHKTIDKLVSFISPHTFFIFLYHILVMNVLQFNVYPHLGLSVKYQFLISFIVVFASMLGYCWIKEKLQQKNAVIK